MLDVARNAEYWWKRSDEARAIAEQLRDPKAIVALLEVALGYRKLAQRAEAQTARGSS